MPLQLVVRQKQQPIQAISSKEQPEPKEKKGEKTHKLISYE
jgi:hypothetical protein